MEVSLALFPSIGVSININQPIILERSFSTSFTADTRPKLKYYPANSMNPSLRYPLQQILIWIIPTMAMTPQMDTVRHHTTRLRLYWMAYRQRTLFLRQAHRLNKGHMGF